MSKNKLKVLQVTGAMNRGGAEVMLMDIYRNISSDIHFDFLVNYKLKEGIVKGDFDEEILAKGAIIEQIATQWDLGPFNYIKAFKKIIKEQGKPDVVHIHLNAKSGIIAWAAKKAGIKKIITHSHADLKFRGSLLYVLVSKLELQFQKYLISKYATNYWGCSQEANNSLFYKRLQTIERCAIIKNAVDVKNFQQVSETKVNELLKLYKAKENTIILGNVGRIVRHKNIAFVLEILNELKKIKIDFRFVIAGRADDEIYMEEFLERAKKYNIENKVIYLGERDDVQTVVNTFDVFVGPALKEGFGLVAVEAQAAGVPCVLYTGFPKSVDMQLNLTIFMENFEVQNWVNAILEVKESKCLDKDLIKNKIETLGYDIIGNTKQIEKLYVK